jgi:hypothetical protein
MSKLIIHNESKKRGLHISDLEGSFNDVIKTLQQWKSEYEGRCSEGEWCKLNIDYYGYDGGSELVVKYFRYETDQEEKLRLEKEVKKRMKAQEKEIAELKALKEKYKDLDI